MLHMSFCVHMLYCIYIRPFSYPAEKTIPATPRVAPTFRTVTTKTCECMCIFFARKINEYVIYYLCVWKNILAPHKNRTKPTTGIHHDNTNRLGTRGKSNHMHTNDRTRTYGFASMWLRSHHKKV